MVTAFDSSDTLALLRVAVPLLTNAPVPNAKLLLITKVVQNLSNGILFGTKELYMGGPLNDFISSNIPVLNKFFASFAVSPTMLAEFPSFLFCKLIFVAICSLSKGYGLYRCSVNTPSFSPVH